MPDDGATTPRSELTKRTQVNDDSHATSPKLRSAPEVVAPTNWVNVALPFSRIEISESREELVELTEVVTDVIDLLQATHPSAEVEKLHERAQALKARLR